MFCKLFRLFTGPGVVLQYRGNDTSARTTSLYDEVLRLYPDDPTLGSPFDPVGLNKSDRIYGPTNQYKRAAAIFGDTAFQSGQYPMPFVKGTATYMFPLRILGRRALLDAYITIDEFYPAYTYLFTQPTAGAPPAAGVSHGSEISFGMNHISCSNLMHIELTCILSVYGNYADLPAGDPMRTVGLYMTSAWIAFANNLHPNRPNRGFFS